MVQGWRWKRQTVASKIILSALSLPMPPSSQAFAINIARALLASAFVCATLPIATVTAADTPPQWAYPENDPNYKPPVDDGNPVRVPNSAASYTWTELRDPFKAPVWHPEDHPPLPDIVAIGRKPDVLACGFCHRADGPGGPENADLAGLPKSYIFNKWLNLRPARAPPPSPPACRRA
jgi:hypothetical protein